MLGSRSPRLLVRVADTSHDTDGGAVALEVPAATFGVCTWGNVHDDVLRGLADSPWAVRNVIPLAQPGNVAFLDAVGQVIESGRERDPWLPFLAENGSARLVVRNDLNRLQTGAPDPAYVRSVLIHSPGITLAESFGPTVGAPSTYSPAGRVRVVEGTGISARPDPSTSMTSTGNRRRTFHAGSPGAPGRRAPALDQGMAEAPGRVPGCWPRTPGRRNGEVLTDGNKSGASQPVRRPEQPLVDHTGLPALPAARARAHAPLPRAPPSGGRPPRAGHRNVVAATSSTCRAFADAQPRWRSAPSRSGPRRRPGDTVEVRPAPRPGGAVVRQTGRRSHVSSTA